MLSRFASLLLWCILLVPAFGQGQINLNNRGLAQVFDATGKPLTGTSFVAQIWYGPSANSLTKSFAPAPFRVSTTVSPGTWNPGATGGPGAIATLEGFAPGSTVTLRVAVWDSSLAGIGAAQALARLPGTGLSEPFTYKIPTDLLATPGGIENMRPFFLVPAGGLVNRPPIAESRSSTVMSWRKVGVSLSGVDPDGDPLSYRILSKPANGTLQGDSTNLYYLPNGGYTGRDFFAFRVNDGKFDSLVGTNYFDVIPFKSNWGWGSSNLNQIKAPVENREIQQISSGFFHTLALIDGAVVSWGHNGDKQLDVPVGLKNVQSVSAGGNQSMVLLTNGTVQQWGYSPRPVPQGLSGIAAIAAGGFHSLALKTNGFVVAWGSNTNREIQVPQTLSNVVGIAAGLNHSVALRSDGSVVVWGIGNTPPDFRGKRVSKVAAGAHHTLALMEDGTVTGWGDNSWGQANVPSGLSKVKEIAAGYFHSVALKNDGALVVWGSNSAGEGTAPQGLSGVTAISAGYQFTIAHTPPPTVESVFWEVPNQSDRCFAGTLVQLIGQVKGFEEGAELKISLWEEDFGRGGNLNNDDYIGSVTSDVYSTDVGLFVSVNWLSTGDPDGFQGSKFYFEVDDSFNRKTIRSPLLNVVDSPSARRLADAIPLASKKGAIDVLGSIDLPDDVDIYSFSVDRDHRLSFDVDLVETNSSFRPFLRLFDSNGTELKSNAGGRGLLEMSANEAYIEHQFTNGGVYFIAVSGFGNNQYNPLNGTGYIVGSKGRYRLTVSSGISGHVKTTNSSLDRLVFLSRIDAPDLPIDSTKPTWIVIHGWNSDINEIGIREMARALVQSRPKDQVLTLDWGSIARSGLLDPWAAAAGIVPVGSWAAAALTQEGFFGHQVNLVGHSFGSYVANEIAKYFPGKINSIVALDPAANAVTSQYDPISNGNVNFSRNTDWSWAFHSSILGNENTPVTAAEAFIFDSGLWSPSTAHSLALKAFAQMIMNPSDPVNLLFSIDNLLDKAYGPWVLDTHSTFFVFEDIVPGYEAVVRMPGGGKITGVSYVTNSPIVSILEPLPMTVFREPRAFIRGQASDFGRGDSGISSVLVNGSAAVGGVSVAAQTAFWSTTVALKLGTNTVHVVVTDASAINPGKVTNSVLVTYQPEFIDLPLQVFDELALASMDLAADDKALSDRVLNHSLKSGPVGLSVTASGRLAWLPTEAQGPSTNLVEVAVSDGEVRTTKRIILVVREVNTPPSLAALPDVILAPGVDWSVPAVGTDVDLPAQSLVYALKFAPTGMSIHRSTGVIRWTPSKVDGPGVFPVTILVTDSFGAAGEQSFRVTVSVPAQTPIFSISSANLDGSITLQIRADRGATVDLEMSGDLNTWVLFRPINGQGMDSPVALVVPTDPITQAVFWRLRLR
jgi:pimeloyl-ACP methyl ester carboxylesterase